MNTTNLVNIKEIDEHTASVLESTPTSLKVFRENGRVFCGRTQEDQEVFEERKADLYLEDEDTGDEPERGPERESEQVQEEYTDAPTPLSMGPIFRGKNAERDRVHTWAIELHKEGNAPGTILELYLEGARTKLRGTVLSPKQAAIVIVDRACKDRPCDDFNCEVHDQPRIARKELVRREGELHLVKNRILRGHLVIIGGDPGTGKTTWTWQVAQELSRGGNFAGEALPEGRALIFCGEPKKDEAYKNFMDRAGHKANHNNVKIVWRADEDVNIKTLDRFTQIIADFEPDLIVLDPIEVYLGLGKGDGGQNDVVMQAGQPLYRIAEKTNAAILGTRFINKKGKLAGCPAFEGLCSRITHLEFDRSYTHQHLDPALGPRIIRDRHDKIRIGCGDPVDELYWHPSSEEYRIKPVNGGYGKRKSVQVANTLRRLFPYKEYAEVKWYQIWGACREIRVSERTVRRVLATHGIVALDQGRGTKRETRYARQYLNDAKRG